MAENQSKVTITIGGKTYETSFDIRKIMDIRDPITLFVKNIIKKHKKQKKNEHRSQQIYEPRGT